MEEVNRQLNEKEYLEYIEQWKEDNKELIESGKCRKVFLECLPRNNHNGGSIDWSNVKENDIYCIYEQFKGFFKILNYDKKNEKVNILYNNYYYSISSVSLRTNSVGFVINKISKNFKIKIRTIFKDEKRDITIIDREYRTIKGIKYKWYKYQCNTCGWDEGWIEESNLLKGIGCSCCYGRTPVLGINTIWDTDKWMIPIVGEEFAKTHTHGNNTDKIYPLCSDCGRKKTKQMTANKIYSRKSISCPCSDKIPYPEKFMFSVLDQLRIEFQAQLTKTIFDWCGKYRYDFYFELNNEKYIIETHGGQHYKKSFERIAVDRKIKTFKEEQENDKNKKELALQNRIKKENYIVIDCRESNLEWIKNSMLSNENFIKLFDLSNINWNKAEEFALSNRVKEACDLWNSNPNITTVDIVKLMKLGRSTIISYLKKGSEKFNWCNYNPKEEQRKNGVKGGLLSSKLTEIFKNGVSLGIFKSASELEKQSKDLFDVKLLSGSISRVCNGKLKIYKGYTFKYIEMKLNQSS